MLLLFLYFIFRFISQPVKTGWVFIFKKDLQIKNLFRYFVNVDDRHSLQNIIK